MRGAEYRLYANANGIWSSQESVYITYDNLTKKLSFGDGSFWVIGCTSAGSERDSGTMYPTLMQDFNGNQILVRYNAGRFADWTNSRARINEIEDVRAVQNGSTYRTYSFTYNTPW